MSCNKYYLCQKGVAEVQECGEQDTFDVMYRMCRAAEVVETCSYAREFHFASLLFLPVLILCWFLSRFYVKCRQGVLVITSSRVERRDGAV